MDHPLSDLSIAAPPEGSGGEPGIPVRSEPALNEEGREQRHMAEWARARRQEVRLVAGLVAGMAVCTLYFALVNAVLIVRALPRPYSVELLGMPSHDEARWALVVVEWEPRTDGGSGAPLVRPVLRLDASEVPQAGAVGTGRLRLDAGHAHRLEVIVPATCTPGRHAGLLRAYLAGPGGAGSLQVAPVPVVVGVTAGFWSSWFVLRNWLVVAAFVAVLLYLLCLLVFPRPWGYLLIARETLPEKVQWVPLRMRRLAWLLPWMRPSLPLSWVWKQARVSPPVGEQGELFFVTSATPPQLFALGRGGRGRFERAMGAVAGLEGFAASDFASCGTSDTMRSVACYRVASQPHGEGLRFRFSKGRMDVL